eukprot:jgi/Astpho2/2251/Aster-x0521
MALAGSGQPEEALEVLKKAVASPEVLTQATRERLLRSFRTPRPPSTRRPQPVSEPAYLFRALQILPLDKAKPYIAAIYQMGKYGATGGLLAIQGVLLEDTRLQAAENSSAARAWRAVILQLGQLRELDAADAAFARMQQAGIWHPTDSLTVGYLLNALSADAARLHARLIKLMNTGFSPTVSNFNVLLKNCMITRDVSRAEGVMQQIGDAGLQADEVSFHTLLKVYDYAGDVDGALKIRDRMAVAGVPLSDEVCTSLLIACGKAGQLEAAFTLWSELQQQGTTQHAESVIAGLLYACSRCGQPQRGLRVLSDLQQSGVFIPLRTYHQAMGLFIHSPDGVVVDEAAKTVAGIRESMRRQSMEPDAEIYSSMLTTFALAKDRNRAVALMQALDAKQFKMTTTVYNAFLKACSSVRDVDQARAAYRRMAAGSRRMQPDRHTFRLMMGIFLQAGCLQEALQVYTDMRRVGVAPSNEAFQKLVGRCAEQALHTGDVRLREQVQQLLLRVHWQGDCLLADLHSLSASEARAAVLCMLASMQESFRRGWKLPSLLVFIVGKGQHTQGLPKLREAVVHLLRGELHMNVIDVGEESS